MVFVGVIPFLNEERHLPRLLESLTRQTRPLDRLVLVDDGSTDASLAIAQRFADGRAGVTVESRPPRTLAPDRLAGAGPLLAFQWAVERLQESWDVAGKLDADIELTPRTIEEIERALLDDDRLGMVGAPLSERDASGALRRMRSRPEQVHGATSFYRRACYEDIMPLPAVVGWDMMDAPRARLRGWRTATVEIPDGDPVHARAMGAQDGLLRAFRRWGHGSYTVGEHPLHVALLGVRHMATRPFVLGGLHYLLGWALGAFARTPRAEPELRKYIRTDQLGRLRARARGALRSVCRLASTQISEGRS